MLKIIEVAKGSVCEEAGIVPTDCIIRFKGFKSVEPIDLAFFDVQRKVKIYLMASDGFKYSVSIEKEEDEPLGLKLEACDEIKRCENNCKFCFVSQLPPKMRKSLYVKDDDYTSSFMFGNYVTLTNLKKDDFKRIIKFRLSPMYISVHAIDDKVRNNLLNNYKIKNLYKILKKFASVGIVMHTQIVLCEGLNDGKVLSDTIQKLAGLYPFVKSLAVVPVGITNYRKNLFKIEPISENLAKAVVLETKTFNKQFYEKFGENFVFASDEFYIKANQSLEKSDYYGDFVQFENGVGMLSKFEADFMQKLTQIKNPKNKIEATVATGFLAYDFFSKLATILNSNYSNIIVNVIAVENKTFGKNVTVAGLLAGKDYLDALTSSKVKSKVLISADSLKYPEEIFLDDMSLSSLASKTNLEIIAVENNAESFISKLLGL